VNAPGLGAASEPLASPAMQWHKKSVSPQRNVRHHV
jgi:hypothetical protein